MWSSPSIYKCTLLCSCSTKAGFISKDMAEVLLSSGRKQGGINREDVVNGNCIHPNCLATSLKRSLKHLKLDTVRSLSSTCDALHMLQDNWSLALPSTAEPCIACMAPLLLLCLPHRWTSCTFTMLRSQQSRWANRCF